MTEPNFKPDDEPLGRLLREARLTPALPPHFQESVWRQIESAEERRSAETTWLGIITGWLLRPRLALAVAVALMFAGMGFGWSRGEQLARQDAQARYLTAVAPNLLR